MIVAAIVGIVVGYGLALWREAHRTRACERDCHVLKLYSRRLVEQDLQITALYLQTDRLARQLVLQAACDRTRIEQA